LLSPVLQKNLVFYTRIRITLATFLSLISLFLVTLRTSVSRGETNNPTHLSEQLVFLRQLAGELNAQSKPVVDHKNKEIFASIKIFSRTYGFEYTTIAEEIKSGLSPEEIINKREKI